MEGTDTKQNRKLSASITARYSDAPKNKKAQVKVINFQGENVIEIYPIEAEYTARWIIT
jgi:hypothetical protein